MLVCTPPERAAPGLRLRWPEVSQRRCVRSSRDSHGSRHRGVAGCFRWTARDNRLRGRMSATQEHRAGQASRRGLIDAFENPRCSGRYHNCLRRPLAARMAPSVAHAQGPKTASRSAQFEAVVEKNVKIAVPDGVRWPPTSTGRPGRQAGGRPVPGALISHPVRQGRRRGEGQYYAARGYVVVANDVRGRYASEGTWRLIATIPRTATTSSSGSPRRNGRTARSARSAPAIRGAPSTHSPR